MKKTTLLLALFATLFTFSCESDNQQNAQVEPNVEDVINSTRAQNMSEEEEFYFAISRKWELGDEYIDLKSDGTFEAKMEEKEVLGKWGMSSSTQDKQELRLIGLGDNSDFNRTYEIINISFERLEGIDKDGNRIQFFAAD